MKIDFLADTNILINLLEGDKRLLPYTEKLLAVSFIREIELPGKPAITSVEVKVCKVLLQDCIVFLYRNN